MTPLDPQDDEDPFLPRLRRFDSMLDPKPHFEATFERPVLGHAAVTSHFNPVFGMARFSSEHIAQLRVSFSAGVSLLDGLQFVHDCRNFFTLVIGRDTPPYDLRLISDDVDHEDTPRRFAELFYSGIGTPTDKEIHPDEMLLPMPSLKDFTPVFSNWMNQASELRLGANWLLGIARRSGFLENNFLSYTQAVEALHRVKNPYRLSLEKRLLDLVGDGAALISGKSALAFVDKVVNTRNFLVHHEPALASKAASDGELSGLALDLRAVVTLFVLTSMGVPRDIALPRILWPRWTY